MSFDAVSVIEVMKGAKDIEIIRKAKKENRIIITNDKDFGWLATTRKPPGVILLRLKEETYGNKIRITKHIIQKYRNVLYRKLIVATETKIRIRPI